MQAEIDAILFGNDSEDDLLSESEHGLWIPKPQ